MGAGPKFQAEESGKWGEICVWGGGVTEGGGQFVRLRTRHTINLCLQNETYFESHT